MYSKYLTNLTGSDVTQQHLSLTFTTRVTLRSRVMVQYVLMARAYVILQKKSVRGKMNQGGPKKGNALLSVRGSHSRGVETHCESQSYLSGTHAKPQSIPWEMIAAKHDNLDDRKQLEDSKPVSNSTLSEDSKLADAPTNYSKLLQEGGYSHC